MSVDILAEQTALGVIVDDAIERVMPILGAVGSVENWVIRDALIEIVMIVSQTHGAAATGVYSQMFDKIRRNSGITDDYDLKIAEAVDIDLVTAKVKWASGELWGKKQVKIVDGVEEVTHNPVRMDVLQSNIEAITTDLVHRQGRNTIADAASDKKSKMIGFARILGVGENCDWCLMLSSRGPVYRSRDTAAAGYHDNCRCTPTPFFRNTVVEGYDRKKLYDQYLETQRKKDEAAQARKAAKYAKYNQ